MNGEFLDRELMATALSALKTMGGENLLRIVTQEAGRPEFAAPERLPTRIPIEDFFLLRDKALQTMGKGFQTWSFLVGQGLLRNLKPEKVEAIRQLVDKSKYAMNELALIGQAAVLGATGSPGSVKTSLDRDRLLIQIQNCPECRGLQRQASPFCFINQGVLTEFARRYLDTEVKTSETKCAAMGDPYCEIEVVKVG
ncbi:MAG: V4R domain-containing protein [Candidatus Methylomirabilales bacterium]